MPRQSPSAAADATLAGHSCVAHGKAQVDACVTQPGEYRGSTTPKAFQAYTVLVANLTQGNRSCQVLHMEFFSGSTCDQKYLVANTTPCYHDCSAQPLCCWAIFALEGSNATIGAYFPTPASPSPSPSPSRRPADGPPDRPCPSGRSPSLPAAQRELAFNNSSLSR